MFSWDCQARSMLRCILQPGCGRLAVAANDIAAGAILFAEEAYTVTPSVAQATKIYCIHCAALVVRKHAQCADCASTYCSEECYTAHKVNHVEHGECAALQFCQRMRAKIPDEDHDTFRMTCLLIARCVAEGKEKHLARDVCAGSIANNGDVKASTAAETVGLGQETANPLDFLNGIDDGSVQATAATYEHVECLATNLAGMNPEIVHDFSCLYDLYMEGVNRKKLMSKLKYMQLFLPPTVSRVTFVSLCCAFLCNGFGFWDARSRQQATAVYPQSSYFNHSCAPNLGRRNLKHSRVMEFFAARSIAKGEQLCISYIDVKLPAAERIAKLKGTYTFTCQCPRCSPDAGFLLANTTIGGAVPPLCEFCQSRVMQPLGDGHHVCPCCERVQTP